MGNQLSGESGTKLSTGSFGRRGTLGLNKSELDKRCQASGLYPSCHWDEKAIRRLIGDGRIAARLKGNETRKNIGDQECPICFLYYPQINVTQCCKANVCTECFLQVKPQKETHICPFCNCSKMYVTIAKRLGAEEIEEREMKEQKVIEAKIKARVQGEEDTSSSAVKTEDGEFGSCLHDDTIRRAKSRTLSESENEEKAGPVDDVQMLRKLSLSFTDRQTLEQEMRAQHTHPLSLKMEAEAEEKRISNEREYNRKNPRRNSESALLHARLMSSGNSSLQNRFARVNGEHFRQMSNSGRSSNGSWFEMMDAFQRVGGNNGDVNTMDDMVVLEAAILLSMEEEARSRNNRSNTAGSNNSQLQANLPIMHQLKKSGSSTFADSSEGRRRFRGRNRIVSLPPMDSNSLASLSRTLTEDEQVAMAIALSMQENQGKKDDGEGENEKKESSGNDAGNSVIFPTVASLPEASDVACLTSKNDGDDTTNDDEEEIVFSRQQTSPNNEKLNGKWSPDDSSYLDMMLDKEEDQKIPVVTNLKKDY